jgi:hypothetical protein
MSSSAFVDFLDAQIASMETGIVVLKRRRNAATRTHRLPHDVLADIFSLVQCSPGPNARESLWTSYDCTWARVMGVCRRFRKVALQAPELWTIVDLRDGRPEWKALCLERAGSTLLSITGDVDEAVSHLSRTRVAYLQGNHDEMVRGALDSLYLNTPGPGLQRLQLESAARRLALTETFLGGSTTSLTHLVLNGDTIVLHKGLVLPSLRYLALHEGVRLSPAENAASLTHLVQHAAHLQTLSIGDIYISGSQNVKLPSAEFIPVTKRVSTPKLQNLIIEAGLAETSALVRILPLPSDVFVVTVAVPWLDDIPVNRNHEAIYSSWLSFARGRPDATELAHGHIFLHRIVGSPISRRCSVYFRASQRIEVMDIGWTRSELMLGFRIPDSEHSLLTGMQVLHICRGALPLSASEYEGLFGLRLMPNIRNILLDHIQDDDANAKRMELLKKWILGRKGRIRSIEVSRCDREVVEFAQGLKQSGVVSSMTS